MPRLQRLLIALLVLSLVLTSSWPAGIGGASQPITVDLDGVVLSFDVPPMIQNDRTLVPFRRVFEALGASVTWQPETQTVTGTKAGVAVVLNIGSRTALVGGLAVALDAPARIVDGRTLVPLRFVGESLGCLVDWNPATRHIAIKTRAGDEAALDTDTDGDGLPDGVEDADQDGIVDPGETDPLNPDTDGDGIPDGTEPSPLQDMDNDGLISALDPDSDGDGLGDGVEDADHDGAVDSGETDPVNPDTDGDGLSDGLEVLAGTSPLALDTDGDGLADAQEATQDAYWGEAERLLVGGGRLPAEGGLAVSLPQAGARVSAATLASPRLPAAGRYQFWARLKATATAQGKPSVILSASGAGLGGAAVAEVHALPWETGPAVPVNVYRWYHTRAFDYTGGPLDLGLTPSPGDGLAVDRLLLVGLDRDDGRAAPLTDPSCPDTDGDGLDDGDESLVPAWWWEAEDWAPAIQSLAWPGFSNGVGVVARGDGTLAVVDSGQVFEAGTYSFYARATSMPPGGAAPASLAVTLTVTPTEGPGAGQAVVIPAQVVVEGVYPDARWSPAYFGGDRSDVDFALASPALIVASVARGPAGGPVLLDKVVLARLSFERPMRAEYLLPRRLTDPMDPDTDGDTYRPDIPGPLQGLQGYLTDGWEVEIGANPLDSDTDHDGLKNGVLLTDDVDPNPFSDDADRDGLTDWIEDPDADGLYDPADGETDWLNPDTDFDGLRDGFEDWNYNGLRDRGETDPRDPDSDGDGLADGGEAGAAGLGRSLILHPADPADLPAINYLKAALASLRDERPGREAAPLVNPYRLNPDGSYTFLGEADVNRPGTSAILSDTDGDGLGDGQEVFIYGTDPTRADTDGDGLDDGLELMVLGTDPLTPDYPDLEVTEAAIVFGPAEPRAEVGRRIAVAIDVTVSNLGSLAAGGGGGASGTAGGGGGPGTHCGRLTLTLTDPSGLEVALPSRDIPPIAAGEAAIVSWEALVFAASDFAAYQRAGGAPANAIIPGRYTVRAAITAEVNEGGRRANNTAGRDLRVLGGPPTAAPSANPLGGRRPLEVVLKAGAADPNGKIVKYEWDLDGNGTFEWSSAASGDLVQTYATAGSYQPVVRVTDDEGLTATERLAAPIQVLGQLRDDADNDGLNTAAEEAAGTDPGKPDTDGDGVKDGDEVAWGLNPKTADSDRDGLADGREVALLALLGLPPTHDADKDGVIDPLDPDADGDGIKDGDETNLVGDDPGLASSWLGTNPYSPDTDGDGLSDALERPPGIQGRYRAQTAPSPTNPDSDGDGLSDYDELMVYDTGVHSPDTDGDGIPDGVDLQPCSSVPGTWAEGDLYPVAGRDGFGWTRLFAPGLVRFTSRVWAYGLAGASFEKQWDGSYKAISPEGVKAANFSDDRVKRAVKLPAYQASAARYVAGSESRSVTITTTTGDGKYRIEYKEVVRDYDVDLVNVAHTRVADYHYRVIRLGLAANRDQALVIQFRFEPGRDRTYAPEPGAGGGGGSGSSRHRYTLPAFAFSLYRSGDVAILADGRLVAGAGPILSDVAVAAEPSPGVYQVEMRIPAGAAAPGNLSGGTAWLVVMPLWVTCGGSGSGGSGIGGSGGSGAGGGGADGGTPSYDGLDPGSLRIGAIQKRVPVGPGRELTVGYSSFSGLSGVPEVSDWSGAAQTSSVSYTLRRAATGGYEVVRAAATRKVSKSPDRVGIGVFHTLTETTVTTERFAALDKVPGEMALPRYAAVRKTFAAADTLTPLAALVVDGATACVASREGAGPLEVALFTEAAFEGLLTSDEVLPYLVSGKSAAKMVGRASQAAGIAVSAAQIGYEVYLGAAETDPFLQRRHYEAAGAEAANAAIWLCPYGWAVQVGWKAVTIPVLALTGVPDNARAETITDPGALIVYAIEYLVLGRIPSEIAELALKNAATVVVKDVNSVSRAGRLAVFLPPE